LAQAPDRPLRIGILSSGDLQNRGHLEESMLQGLRDQGYVEGKNLFVERRYGGATWRERASELAQELGALKLDAVLTTCTPSTALAKRTMPSTPIVMAAVSDPVGQGIIASLARPGGNVTGLSSQGEELLPKMFELFSSVLPRGTTVAVLGNVRNPAHTRMWQALQSSGPLRTLDLKLMRIDAEGPGNVAAVIESAARNGAGALFVLGDDPLALNARPQILRTAAKYRLPDFYWAREFVDEGGLMSYGENLRRSYRALAGYVSKMAKGARPGELPVEQPTKFELVINRKAAKTLGLAIPPQLALLADEIIE
jgi:putative ABC transport system substrate-binding protein